MPTLQLRSSEVFQNLLPVRWVVISPKVWLQLATQNLQCRTLANTVGPYESQHLTRPRHRQPVEFETVRGVPMGDLSLEIGRQIDNVDGVERAFFRADTATDAETLGYEGDSGVGSDFDT